MSEVSKAALEKLFKKNYQRYVKAVHRRAGSIENAEDVVMNAFERALRYLKDEDVGNLEGWFTVTLNNALKDYMTAERKFGMTSDVDGLELEDEAQEVFRGDELHHIIKAVNKLPDSPAKEVLTLYYKYNYRVKEIADARDDMAEHQVRYIVDTHNNKMAKRFSR